MLVGIDSGIVTMAISDELVVVVSEAVITVVVSETEIVVAVETEVSVALEFEVLESEVTDWLVLEALVNDCEGIVMKVA